VIKFFSLIATVLLLVFSGSAKAEENPVVLSSDNFILISGEITEESSSDFITKLLTFKGDEVVIYINSPGGSIASGMKMYQAVKDLKAVNKNLKTKCYVDFAASMAFTLTQTICDQRLLGQTSLLMQHQAAFGVQGREGEVDARYRMIKDVIEVMNKAEAKRLNVSVEKLDKLTKDEWWLVGEKAVSQNAADSLAPVTCTAELVQSSRKQNATLFGFQIELTFSGCPLIEYPTDIKIKRLNVSDEDKTKIHKKIYESIESRKKILSTLP